MLYVIMLFVNILCYYVYYTSKIVSRNWLLVKSNALTPVSGKLCLLSRTVLLGVEELELVIVMISFFKLLCELSSWMLDVTISELRRDPVDDFFFSNNNCLNNDAINKINTNILYYVFNLIINCIYVKIIAKKYNNNKYYLSIFWNESELINK